VAIGTDGKEGRGAGVMLVVDDEDIVRRLTTRMLESDGFRVVEARSGSEALDLLGTLGVQLVVCDIEMHGMSGFDLADLMSAHWPDVPLILMSGHGRPPSEYARHFLAKPFTTDELLGAVETLVRRAAPAPESPSTTADSRPRRA